MNVRKMSECRMKYCKTEYETSQAHELKTQELTKILSQLATVKSMSKIDKIFKKYEKIAMKSPQIIYSRCIYKHCKKRFIKIFKILIDNVDDGYKRLNLQHYVPEFVQRANNLINKPTHTDSELLQISFYILLSIYSLGNQRPVKK
jgi:hypothetical protein